LGIPYKTCKEIGQHALGVDGYERWRVQRKSVSGSNNLKIAHRIYADLSSEDRAELLKRRFGGTCALEARLSERLKEDNLIFELNVWQSIPINGKKVPREADIKVDLGAGRKLVILCDGEAFHGPRTIYGDPKDRINDDVMTAKAYFSLGYSVIRYSETEINSGWAMQHLRSVLPQLKTQNMLRIWFPY
jgi:hypothetical protein